jgi:hypothetical protein
LKSQADEISHLKSLLKEKDLLIYQLKNKTFAAPIPA